MVDFAEKPMIVDRTRDAIPMLHWFGLPTAMMLPPAFSSTLYNKAPLHKSCAHYTKFWISSSRLQFARLSAILLVEQSFQAARGREK